MTRPFDFGEVKLALGENEGQRLLDSDTPFRLLVLGDFSGRDARGICETGEKLAARRPIEVDRDNFDKVLASLRPELVIPMGGEQGLRLEFAELDDFHPDRLLERALIFRKLRELRLRLADPSTYKAAAQELGIAAPGAPAPAQEMETESVNAGPSSPKPIVSGSLLDDLIEQTEARKTGRPPSRAPDELQQFVRRVTEPHLVAAADPHQAQALSMIDRALSLQLRALLHVPQLQALEAAWRALFLLVRRVETSSELKIYVLDVSRQELAADLAASRDLVQSGTFRLLVEKTVGTPGEDLWTVFAGLYTFGAGREDCETLGRLARIAHASGAPFLAAASPNLLGCSEIMELGDPRAWRQVRDPDDAAAWAALRGLPEAAFIGLTLPRFLLRLPYGKMTDHIESFEFEEMPEPEHESYLWGNPSIACSLLLSQAFEDEQWDMRPGTQSEIDRLPLHVYLEDGGSELKPCAETLLTVAAAETILERGIMPLASIKGRDAVRLLRFQSIAEPLRPLAGRWQR